MIDAEKLARNMLSSFTISEFTHGVCQDFARRFGKAAFDIRVIDSSEAAYRILEMCAIEALDACKKSIDEMKKDGSLKLYVEDLIAKKEEE